MGLEEDMPDRVSDLESLLTQHAGHEDALISEMRRHIGSKNKPKDISPRMDQLLEEVTSALQQQPIDHPTVYAAHYRLATAVAVSAAQDTSRVQEVLAMLTEKIDRLLNENVTCNPKELADLQPTRAIFNNARKPSIQKIFVSLKAAAEADRRSDIATALGTW